MNKGSVIEIISALAIVFLVGALLISEIYGPVIPMRTDLKKFSSCEEMEEFVKMSTEVSPYYGFGIVARTFGTGAEISEPAAVTQEAAKAAPSEYSEDYSTTNIQVTGVDEADIVKNDGKYIYVVSGNNVVIVDAYPAEEAEIMSEIELDEYPQEIFINKNKLVVFSTKYDYGSKTFIKVYDVSDVSNPVLKRNVSFDGDYYDSRMIGDYIYVIMNEPLPYYPENEVRIPEISSEGISKPVCGCVDVYYFDFPDYSYRFTTIAAVNTQNDEERLTSKVFLMGITQNMYVSLNNIYITYTKRLDYAVYREKLIDEVIIPSAPLSVAGEIESIRNSNLNSYEKWSQINGVLRNYVESLNPEEGAVFYKKFGEKMVEFEEDIAKELEKTVIHKISVDREKIEYKTNGEVPGNVLNQFSMDENNGYFRIATTTSGSFGMFERGAESKNNVYILDEYLSIVSKLEDLASGERIYSVRFIGNKGYVVTFRQIDPLFVIDLSSPTNPRVLGFLKITGVSDYLHPYDETHLIGVGRDATEEGRIKGMKLSLFDITDVSNPKEISKYIIGERGTDSDALTDHKAFLFSKAKNLLVIPIRLSEKERWNVWQGAYVFNVDLDNGFVLNGKITHENRTEDEKEYYFDYASSIRRSLYIDNVLYTVSSKMIKMNNLIDLNEIKKIELPYEEEIRPIPLRE